MGQSFKDLVVWQRAIELTVAIYKLTSKFPDSERFGLTNQLRRAAVSIANNIAEGFGRATKGEYVQFIGHAVPVPKSKLKSSLPKPLVSAQR